MDHLNLKLVAETADPLNRTLRKLIVPDQGMHAETVVVSSARLAGVMLLRHQLSEASESDIDTALATGSVEQRAPLLFQILFATLRQLGYGDIDENLPDGGPGSTSASRLSLGETLEILEPWYYKTAARSQLSLLEVAASSAMCTALLIHDCREALDVSTGCAIATHGFVEPFRIYRAGLVQAA